MIQAARPAISAHEAFTNYCVTVFDEYESFIVAEPFVVPSSTNNDFHRLQKLMFRVISGLVERFEELRAISNYSDEVSRVMELWSQAPFCPGSYRTDFVFDTDMNPWMIEITSRMGFNGYFLNGVFHEAARRFSDQSGKSSQRYREYDGFFEYFLKLLDQRQHVVFLKGRFEKNESRYMKRLFPDFGLTCHDVSYQDILSEQELLSKSLIVSELGLDEILSLKEEVHMMLSTQRMVNDFRNPLLVHDKHFFTLLSNPVFLRNFLSEEETAYFLGFCAPTFDFDPGDLAQKQALIENRNNWIIKHRQLGKSERIYAGVGMEQAQWTAAIETMKEGEFVVQKWISQPRLRFELGGEFRNDYATGTLLFFDDNYFGMGMLRFSPEPVYGPGQFVKGVVVRED